MEENEQNLTPKEQYELKKKERMGLRKKEQVKEKINKAPKKIGKYLLYAGIGLGAIGIFVALSFVTTLGSNLPPTSQQNHSESSPPSHIITTPMPDVIQRHMLEHADGSGPSSIIIQYNCNDYVCEDGLVEQLTALVQQFPANVYLAPNNYDGKIILTKLGRRKILDEFNEQEIRDFIGN